MADERLNLCAESHDVTSSPPFSESLLDPETAARVADLFKALSDPTRVRIISLLVHAELCVGELARLLEMTQPAVSHQLRVLRNLRIVHGRKEGRHVYYALMDEHIRDLFEQGLAHVKFG